MVKDTTYYEALEVEVDATPAQIKRAYRTMAIKTHPDKNPGDETAKQRFQEVSEAYQVLSDAELRKRYDLYGKEESKPAGGFEDPVEFATNIFGGEAFQPWIGELSLIKEMTQLGQLEEEYEKEQETAAAAAGGAGAGAGAGAAADAAAGPSGDGARASAGPEAAGLKTDADATVSPTDSRNAGKHERRHIPRLLHHHSNSVDSHSSARTGAAASTGAGAGGVTAAASEKEAKLAAKQKRKQELDRLDKENREAREKRVQELTKTLIEKLSVFTESSKDKQFTENFIKKMEMEANELKMESFGLQLLQVIGTTYYTKASLFLKSQKLFGFGGMFGKIKDAGNMMRDVYDTISATMDAKSYIETAAEMENANIPAEKQAELEQTILGKILGAMWVGSRFEIQGVLREVCDRVLHDKTVPLSKRVERAQGLRAIGLVFKTTERTPEENEEMQLFESIVAQANAKKAKKLRKEYAAGTAAAAAAAQSEAAPEKAQK